MCIHFKRQTEAERARLVNGGNLQACYCAVCQLRTLPSLLPSLPRCHTLPAVDQEGKGTDCWRTAVPLQLPCSQIVLCTSTDAPHHFPSSFSSPPYSCSFSLFFSLHQEPPSPASLSPPSVAPFPTPTLPLLFPPSFHPPLELM